MGVIGVGRWGRNLIRNFDAMGCLAGLCDSDSVALDSIAAQHPAAGRFVAFEEMIRSGNINAVAIATPPSTHAFLAQSALDAGLDVFVEKPMTTDLASARALVTQARAGGRQLMTGHLLRYHPAFQTLLEQIRTGAIGQVQEMASSRLVPGPEIPREHVLWEFAAHDISMLLACADAVPVSVQCIDGEGDAGQPGRLHASIRLTFASGVEAITTVSWRSPAKVQLLSVHGEIGSLEFNDVAPPESKLLFRSGGEAETAISFPAEEPLARECAAFVSAVVSGKPPASDALEGLQVMTVLDACFRSLADGRPVALEPMEEAA